MTDDVGTIEPAGQGYEAALVLDVGQTGIKNRLIRSGQLVERTDPGIRTSVPLAPQIAEVIRRWCAGGATPSVVAIGLSGVTDIEAESSALMTLIRPLGVRRTLLAHDSVTSYLGAMGDRFGAVVAAGTGVVTMGVGPSRVARVDGWGNLIGDAGSGYWIGRAGLEAAMRAYDGRGSSSALLEMLRREWPDPAAAYIDLQQDPDRVRRVASFAPHVIALADDDPTARRICSAAAVELGMSAIAALTAVTDIDHPLEGWVVTAVGGIFASPAISKPFKAHLDSQQWDVPFIEPRGSGLDGAEMLRRLASSHPLRAYVADAD